jgi:hypothetical protein
LYEQNQLSVPICEITISSTFKIKEATTFGSDIAPAGFIFVPAFSTVSTDCDGLVDPAIWGTDIAASVANGSQTFGVALTAPLTSADPLWSDLELWYGASNWGQLDPYAHGASVYMSALGGFMQFDIDGDGISDTIGWGMSNEVDSLWVETGNVNDKNIVLTTNGSFIGDNFYILSYGIPDLTFLFY